MRINDNDSIDDDLMESLRFGFDALALMDPGQCIHIDGVAFWKCAQCPCVHGEVIKFGVDVTLRADPCGVSFEFFESKGGTCDDDREGIEESVIAALYEYTRRQVMH